MESGNNIEILPLARIESQARFVICSPSSGGIISEYDCASDLAVAFFKYAVKELKGPVVAMPGIYKRTSYGWAKV